ncbi:hypothetical protein MUP79_03450 [Candidatus Bathyarchaeota archaeon]|nr:hypothetical protein [Candidatus Bathyarchaeota archaeon]
MKTEKHSKDVELKLISELMKNSRRSDRARTSFVVDMASKSHFHTLSLPAVAEYIVKAVKEGTNHERE